MTSDLASQTEGTANVGVCLHMMSFREVLEVGHNNAEYTYLHQEFVGALWSCWLCGLGLVRKEDHTMTCKSKEVPTAESLAFWYHEFNRASLLVCDIDRVSIYVPIPGFESFRPRPG